MVVSVKSKMLSSPVAKSAMFKRIVANGLRPRLAVILLALAVALATTSVSCSPAREDPFARGHRGTPTPTPQPDETPADVLVHQYDLLTKGETIKIADWSDNRTNLINFIAGYVIVFGFNHAVELVNLENADYEKALLEGDVHLVLQMDEAWYRKTGGAAGILDIGAPFSATPGLRIGVNPGLREISPEIVEFLGKFAPGDDQTNQLASQITSGRVGMRANAAGVKYFKNHEDVWAQWVDDESVQLVKDAVKGNKTALINRKCIPDGGNQNCVR